MDKGWTPVPGATHGAFYSLRSRAVNSARAGLRQAEPLLRRAVHGTGAPAAQTIRVSERPQ
jgi:hypothetical protein